MMVLQNIFEWVEIYKYLIIFPIVVVEGPIIIIICGFLVSLGKLDFWTAYFLLVIGDVIGDILYYYIGRYGRTWLASGILKRAGVTPERMKKLELHFSKNAGATLLIAKFVHFLGGATLITAGAAKTRFRVFIYYSILGTLMKTMLLMLIGYLFGSQYLKIDNYLAYYSYAIIILVALCAAFFIVSKKISERFLTD